MKAGKAISALPRELKGSLWGITTFFNPCRYAIRLTNYKKFREASRKQGLKLICVELTFGASPYELSDEDAEIMVRRRTTSVLWQKERLLNCALKYLPEDCDKVAWLDADLLFLNDHWIKETSDLLNSYAVVQPFAFVRYLPKEGPLDGCQRSVESNKGHEPHSFGYGIAHHGADAFQSLSLSGLPGHAWGIRRAIVDYCGFYDRLILGSADSVMAFGFFGRNCHYLAKYFTKAMEDDLEEWKVKMYSQVHGSVYYTHGTIGHLWHGDQQFRHHHTRELMYKKINFSPLSDIRLDENDCWVWATKKPFLHLFCKTYFKLRNEEGVNSKWAGWLAVLWHQYLHGGCIRRIVSKMARKLFGTG